MMPARQSVFVGIDIGTSGCRAIAIDGAGTVAATSRVSLPEPTRVGGGGIEQAPEIWWTAVLRLLDELFKQLRSIKVGSLAVDGTSGTVLLADTSGTPLGPALMYNDNRAVTQAERISRVAPIDSAAYGTGSGLAKTLWLLERHGAEGVRVYTQADWINWRLSGRWFSDSNNSLKTGFDAVKNSWPEWLGSLGVPGETLPPVYHPGTRTAVLLPELASRWGLESLPAIAAGTTDSTAAIIATGAHQIGDGVTSLGSTLVTKVISSHPISAPEYGVYSQPLGDKWLVGGGSNTGGAVLLEYFSPEQMARLSAGIDPEEPTGLDYYPLLVPGERFPVNDPTMKPRLSPRPDNDSRFFQGLLESMARIEQTAYLKLEELGAPYPHRIFSTGGGAANDTWNRIRKRLLTAPLVIPLHSEAAFGAAMLARGRQQ